MALHMCHDSVNTLVAIHIMNEPRWRVRDTVATELLKINPDFFSIKTKKTDKETMLKPANISKINA